MSEDERRAVRPRWICGTAGEGVEQESDSWEEYAKKLKDAVKAKREETATGAGGHEELHGEDPEEHGQRKTKNMLDPKLPSSEEV